MVQRHPLTVHVPIRGKVLVRLDGTEVLHEVGEFSQQVPVVFAPGPGEVSFQFEEKFWEGAVKNQKAGGRKSDPLPNPGQSTGSLVLGVLNNYQVPFPDGIAVAICERLEKEGRLSA